MIVQAYEHCALPFDQVLALCAVSQIIILPKVPDTKESSRVFLFNVSGSVLFIKRCPKLRFLTCYIARKASVSRLEDFAGTEEF
ncbi:hypothetical protein AJ87_48745 [Rhizobium yanglingense]|nr:hypothetical protein AJ87_48745 [Rhizobium yanglingense]